MFPLLARWARKACRGRIAPLAVGSGVCVLAAGTSYGAVEAEKEGKDRLRVLFIRHGESENNVLCKVSWEHYKKFRKPDPYLSEKGALQANAAAEYLAKAPPVITPLHGIYTSPMLRTLETTKPLASKLKMNPIVWADMYEVGGCFGGQEGHFHGEGGFTHTEILNKYPEYIILDGVTEKGWYPKPLAKEPHSHAESRAAAIATRLRDMAMRVEGDVNIACVAHHDTIDLVLRELLDMKASVNTNPPGTIFKHYNTAMTCVDLYSDGTRPATMLFSNRTDHLSKDLVEWEKLGLV